MGGWGHMEEDQQPVMLACIVMLACAGEAVFTHKTANGSRRLSEGKEKQSLCR